MIEETKYHPKNHVYDSHDDRHFHFVRVQESQLIEGNIPDLKEIDKESKE